MPLHSQAAAFLNGLKLQKIPPLEELPLETARWALVFGSKVNFAPPELARIETRTILGPEGGELTIRIYWPPGEGPFGACLYISWRRLGAEQHRHARRRVVAAC